MVAFQLPGYIDASCRREPDFQATIPSISALCRGASFAPRLRVGDEVIYMTVQGRYGKESFSHWRLVAILRVISRFASHEDASSWYIELDQPLPSNCMVEGNPCFPYNMTAGTNKFPEISNPDHLLRVWDRSYRERSRKYPTFLACEPEFIELNQPPIVTRAQLLDIFGRIPPTLNPPGISEMEYQALRSIALPT